jgi:pyruvate kinase
MLEDGEVKIVTGSTISLLKADGTKGSEDRIYIEAFDPVEVVRTGEKVLLADGRIELVAQTVHSDRVECVVRSGGLLRSRSGIAVPESRLYLPCVTDKDKEDLQWGLENDVDFIALSFVGNASDVASLKKLISAAGKSTPVVSKVERAVSLDNLAGIVELSDAVMVARGDLGLEIPLERVPSAQRSIIEVANFSGVPVITATQMLMSMVNEIRPTRAEVSDVTTAVRDGTDAVMLSDETAIGKYPVESVQVLSKILLEAEREVNFERLRPRSKGSDRERVTDAVCYAAVNAADKIGAAAIVACTNSGYTARLMAKYRPTQPLFGISPSKRSLLKMVLCWGVIPVHNELEDKATHEEEVSRALALLRNNYGLKPGARVVITAGLGTKLSGSTTLMEIREIPR